MKRILPLLLLGFAPVFSEDPKIDIEPLAEGLGFTEGPVWMPELTGVVFSAPRDSVLYLWTEAEGLKRFRENTGAGNGNILDREGRLITCEGKNKRLVRQEKDGKITVLADACEGEPFNNPNDVAAGADGSVYFTDPNFGMRREKENHQFLYRIRPDGEVEKALPQPFNKPNGVAVSPDGRTLYLNEGANHWTLAFRIKEDGSLEEESRRVADGMDKNLDGLAVHPETGDLYIAVFTNNRRKPDEQGLQIFTANGKYKGMIPLPGHTTNVCFGADAQTLYATSGGALYRIRLTP